MLITKIKLHNFKKYYLQNDYVLDLTKNNKISDLVVISGKNASGKTTLCEAIYLTFTKKTYDNTTFKFSYEELSQVDNIAVEIEFTSDDNISHTIKREITADARHNIVYTTYIDNNLVADRNVEKKLKDIKINGIENFFLCTHPLYLTELSASNNATIELFFKIMQNAVVNETKNLVSQLSNLTINYENETYKLFDTSELSTLASNPFSVIEYIKTLTSQTKDFNTELVAKQEELSYFIKNTTFLSTDELNTKKANLTNLNNELKQLNQQKITYNQKLDTIDNLNYQIDNAKRSINSYLTKSVNIKESATYQKNLKIRTFFIDFFSSYLKNIVNEFIAQKVIQDINHWQDNKNDTTILSILHEINNTNLASLNHYLDSTFSLENIDFSNEIKVYENNISNYESQKQTLNNELTALNLDMNKINERISQLSNEINTIELDLRNDSNLYLKKQSLENQINELKAKNLTGYLNMNKIGYLNDFKTKCLDLMTNYINTKTLRTKIVLSFDNASKPIFNIYSKTNDLIFYKLNKAEQWLIGYDLMSLFQNISHAKLPFMFDGAESIDASNRKLLVNDFLAKNHNMHQLFIMFVKDKDYQVGLV